MLEVRMERHEPDRRPIIRIEAGSFVALAEKAEEAILHGGLPVYVGAAGLVYPAKKEVETAEGVFTSLTQLTPISVTIMQQFMDQAARFDRFDGRSNKWRRTKPPRDIAELMIARKGYWPYLEVIGILSAPTIGADGDIITSPGLDPRSKLLLSGAPVVSVPSWPSRQEALAAVDVLDGLLVEYQFADKASHSVALSMLITPLLRGLLPLAPLHAVSAPVAGSGKSYLASLSTAIATGYHCPVIPPAEKKEEFEKRLIGALLSGMPIISFDNVNCVLDDGTLCQALEQRLIRVRALGSSQLYEVEQRTTWFANGNNIEIAQDLTRRTILCRLDRNEERPELYEYDRRPYELVLANRAKYITAALTIVRAYIAAGRPGKLAPLASYEAWSDNVRSALVWLGRADCCDSMRNVREADGKLQRLRSLLAAWNCALGLGMEYAASVVVKAAEDRKDGRPGVFGETLPEPDPELWEAIVECIGSRGTIDAVGLGNYLKKVADRVVSVDGEGGKSIQVKLIKTDVPTRSGVAQWALKEV